LQALQLTVLGASCALLKVARMSIIQREGLPMRNTLILAAIAAMAFSSVAEAKACKDAKGHFTKCDTPAAAPMMRASNKAGPGTCKDKHGHFAKCGTVLAIPPMAPRAMNPVSAGAHHPNCKKGKPCGNTCIAQDRVCHK